MPWSYDTVIISQFSRERTNTFQSAGDFFEALGDVALILLGIFAVSNAEFATAAACSRNVAPVSKAVVAVLIVLTACPIESSRESRSLARLVNERAEVPERTK